MPIPASSHRSSLRLQLPHGEDEAESTYMPLVSLQLQLPSPVEAEFAGAPHLTRHAWAPAQPVFAPSTPTGQRIASWPSMKCPGAPRVATTRKAAKPAKPAPAGISGLWMTQHPLQDAAAATQQQLSSLSLSPLGPGGAACAASIDEMRKVFAAWWLASSAMEVE